MLKSLLLTRGGDKKREAIKTPLNLLVTNKNQL